MPKAYDAVFEDDVAEDLAEGGAAADDDEEADERSVDSDAGIETTGSVTTCDDGEWDRQIGVNLNGTYRISRFAVPAMIASGGGSVINISSVGGLVAVKDDSAFGASLYVVLRLDQEHVRRLRGA